MKFIDEYEGLKEFTFDGKTYLFYFEFEPDDNYYAIRRKAVLDDIFSHYLSAHYKDFFKHSILDLRRNNV